MEKQNVLLTILISLVILIFLVLVLYPQFEEAPVGEAIFISVLPAGEAGIHVDKEDIIEVVEEANQVLEIPIRFRLPDHRVSARGSFVLDFNPDVLNCPTDSDIMYRDIESQFDRFDTIGYTCDDTNGVFRFHFVAHCNDEHCSNGYSEGETHTLLWFAPEAETTGNTEFEITEFVMRDLKGNNLFQMSEVKSDDVVVVCSGKEFCAEGMRCEEGGCVVQEDKVPFCGNNVIEGQEECDGLDLADETCTSLDYLGGDLACTDDCFGFDTSSCFLCDSDDVCDSANVCRAGRCVEDDSGPFCGNNVIEGGEICDGTDLAGKTCKELDFAAGELSCSNDCSTIVTNLCVESVVVEILDNNRPVKVLAPGQTYTVRVKVTAASDIPKDHLIIATINQGQEQTDSFTSRRPALDEGDIETIAFTYQAQGEEIKVKVFVWNNFLDSHVVWRQLVGPKTIRFPVEAQT